MEVFLYVPLNFLRLQRTQGFIMVQDVRGEEVCDWNLSCLIPALFCFPAAVGAAGRGWVVVDGVAEVVDDAHVGVAETERIRVVVSDGANEEVDGEWDAVESESGCY
jgi:hypothetical protein